MGKDNITPCIQVELADYCFDQEVIPDPGYDESHKNNILNAADDSYLMESILNAPDDADLEELRRLLLVEDLLLQRIIK